MVYIGLQHFVFSYQEVSIINKSELAVNIYASADDHDDPTQYTGQSLKTIKGSTTFKMKKGSYVIVTEKNDSYKQIILPLYLEDSHAHIDIKPQYSDEKLQLMLVQELPAITEAIRKTYQDISSYYTQEPGWLYEKGEWYATKLKYVGQGDIFKNDTLRIILHKESGVWKVITLPPDIVISHVLYPQIPREILIDINNFR